MKQKNKKIYEEKNLTDKCQYIGNSTDKPLKLVSRLKDKNCKINYNCNQQLKDTHKM